MITAVQATHSQSHLNLRDQIAGLIGVAPHRMTRSRHRPWSSVRFSGTRHEFFFGCETVVAPSVAHLLRAHEFALDGEIVADASLTRDGDCYRVEALTVEAR